MGSLQQQAEAVVAQVETKLHKGQGSRLTDAQRAAILKLARLDKTQVEIAQAIGCDQGTVSRWLSQCQDSTELASSYLRGSALRMARNIVQKGLARDHIQALNGLGVLNQQDTSKLTLVINGLTLHGTGPGVVEGEVLSPPQLVESSEGGSIP